MNASRIIRPLLIYSGWLCWATLATAAQATMCSQSQAQIALAEPRPPHETSLAALVRKTENLLNRCAEPDRSLAKQKQLLYWTQQIARRLCPDTYAWTQLLHIGKASNTNTALIVHSHMKSCVDRPSDTLVQDVSILFSRSAKDRLWHGHLVWPVALIGRDLSWETIQKTELLPMTTRNKIYLLRWLDRQGRRFLAMEGLRVGGDHQAQILAVLRLQDEQPPTVKTDLEFSDWCGQPHSWKISGEANLVVAGARSTYRCGSREAEIYPLEDPTRP